MKRIWDSLGGARGIGLFAAISIAAMIAMLMLGGNEMEAQEGGGNRLEQRLTEILECLDGVGKAHVFIAQNDSGEPTGAIVVADELRDMRTWLNVQAAVEAALGLDASAIHITGANGLEGGFQ